MDDVWTEQDQQQALSLGWGVFECPGIGPRIRRYREAGVFAHDELALDYVERIAAAGNALAKKALEVTEPFEQLAGATDPQMKDYFIRVGIDVPAFAGLDVTAPDLPSAMRQAEKLAKEMDGMDFEPEPGEWQDRLRIVSVMQVGTEKEYPQLEDVLLRNTRSDAEEAAFELLGELLNNAFLLPETQADVQRVYNQLAARDTHNKPPIDWDAVCNRSQT
jgi:hypothetical protein